MTDDTAQPSTAATRRSQPGRVEGKVQAACDLIVHQGIEWDQAAVKVGLTVRAMRLALKRPHVLAYLKQEKLVLLASITAQNPRRLAQLRDQNSNPAASVRAAVALDQMMEGGAGSLGRPTMAPGSTIQIVNAIPARTGDSKMIEPEPAPRQVEHRAVEQEFEPPRPTRDFIPVPEPLEEQPVDIPPPIEEPRVPADELVYSHGTPMVVGRERLAPEGMRGINESTTPRPPQRRSSRFRQRRARAVDAQAGSWRAMRAPLERASATHSSTGFKVC
jgi:hypothetical protein